MAHAEGFSTLNPRLPYIFEIIEDKRIIRYCHSDLLVLDSVLYYVYYDFEWLSTSDMNEIYLSTSIDGMKRPCMNGMVS